MTLEFACLPLSDKAGKVSFRFFHKWFCISPVAYFFILTWRIFSARNAHGRHVCISSALLYAVTTVKFSLTVPLLRAENGNLHLCITVSSFGPESDDEMFVFIERYGILHHLLRNKGEKAIPRQQGISRILRKQLGGKELKCYADRLVMGRRMGRLRCSK